MMTTIFILIAKDLPLPQLVQLCRRRCDKNGWPAFGQDMIEECNSGPFSGSAANHTRTKVWASCICVMAQRQGT